MSDKIQYWINKDGVQQGPLTIEQLREMGLDHQAYVWSAGFDDWKPITEVPELAELVPAPAIPAIPEETSPTTTVATSQQPVPAVTVQPMQPSQQGVPAGQAYPPCPPTNMVWAIISMLLCCIPLGIVAIYYANKVSKKYYEGDLAAAEHYSEVSAWWCIGTIVGGIIASPFVSLIQMALMS